MANGSFDYVGGLKLSIVKRRIGRACFRIHRTIHDPLWFGPDKTAPVRGRFNAPGYEYGVCYFGLSLDVAFAETLLRNPANRLLSRGDLTVRSISTGHLTREIHLVQAYGPGLSKLRITAGVIHGPHDMCRNLAFELWKHSEQVDGIAYHSRFDDNELCIALFDRAKDAVIIDSTGGLVDDARQLGRILNKYHVGLDP